VPRSADALGSWRPRDRRVCRLYQPDAPLRDGVADPAREPHCSCRSARPVDRQGAHAPTAADNRARHGFEREPDLRRAGRQRLQRAFRLHLLPPAFRVQPARRCGALCPAFGERPQRQRLERGVGARGLPLPHGEAPLFPRRLGLREPGDLRVPRSRGIRLCDPAADQSRLAGQDRAPAQAPGRSTAA